MGQKINPTSLRIGISKNWPVRWFLSNKQGNRTISATNSYRAFLEEDEAIRNIIKQKVAQAGIASVEIDRTSNNVKISICAARPGFIIGRGGKGIEELSAAIEKAVSKVRGKKAKGISVDVEELKRTDVSAAYVAQQIAWDIEKRIPFRQAMRKHLEAIMQNRQVLGAKIFFSGRLDGAEIARREWKAAGSLPLQTLRANADYSRSTAFTTYGTVGIKVWIYKGEVFEKELANKNQDFKSENNSRNFSPSNNTK